MLKYTLFSKNVRKFNKDDNIHKYAKLEEIRPLSELGAEKIAFLTNFDGHTGGQTDGRP